MPVIKSAKKKLRQDKKRTLKNVKAEVALKDAIKAAVKSPSVKTLGAAASLLDKAAKKHIIHANKAARLKSRLAHLLSPKKAGNDAKPVSTKKPTKKVTKKTRSTGKKSPAKKK